MNEQLNAPMPAEPAGVAGWFSTWMAAVTKPNEQTYATMAEHPDAMSVSRAFTWVFLAGTISALISGILQAILQLAGFASQAPSLGDLFGRNAGRGVGLSFVIAICGSPVAGAISTFFFAIGIGIIQWVAKMFKGVGTFSQLAYVMAAVSVPISIVSSVFTPFSGIRFVSICTGLISVLLILYSIVLEVVAVKGVNKFGWGQALGSIFLPVIVLACCLAIPIIATMTVLGPIIGNTFSSINNSLP